jgi:polysaccharide pyruvyl transferase WcaK-like protein
MAKALVLHSWSRNMGDAAMLETIVSMVKRASPAMEVAALVSHPEFTRTRLSCAGVSLAGWPWPLPARGRPSPAELAAYPFILLNNVASAAIFRLTGKKLFLANRRFAGPLTKLFECDLAISPGGDFISPKYYFITTFSEFLIAKILGKRLVVCAQSIGPFGGLLHPWIAGFFLRMPDLVMVREEGSARYLESVGIHAHVTADLAFAYGHGGARKGPAQAEGIRRIAVSAKRMSGDPAAYEDGMLRLIRRAREEFGCEVLIIPTDSYDIPVQERLARKAGGGVRLIREVLAPKEIAAILGTCDFIVSSRMHAIILGSASQTPFFAITDSFKFKGILGMLCEGCTVPAEHLDGAAVESVISSMHESGRLRERISKSLPAMRRRAMQNGAIMAEKFAEWKLA